MGLFELFLIAVGLSMDAFAVAICTGLGLPKVNFKNSVVVGLYFGGFQAAMPLAGYFIGIRFADSITAYDHWIAFILLGLIGGKMIKDSFSHDDGEPEAVVSLGPSKMLPLAVATSIDALAVGVSFAFLSVRIAPAVGFIGVTTLVLSMLGVKIGNVFGTRYKSRAELAGGVILMLMGVKILAEHLGLLDLICNIMDNTVK